MSADIDEGFYPGWLGVWKEVKVGAKKTKGCGTRKLPKQFPQKKDERRFRQFGYVLILFLIVAINKFFK